MGLRKGSVAGLLAGAASTGLNAQGVGAPAARDQATLVQTSPAKPSLEPAVPPKIQFRGADGKPLPPEIQRQLEERFRNDPRLPSQGQATPPGGEGNDVVVTGRKPRGSVIGDIPPERTFNPIDIRAYGASDVGELLQALGPQVSSSRGREDSGPVVLLNGKRVSSFTEIARIPPEAIERMEVFPEELALKYGYRADQKVVNVVAFERFSSRVGQLTYGVPTDGGRDTIGINANYLHIRGDTRFNADADYGRSGSLLESERAVLQIPGSPDLGRFRTLLPASERLVLNGAVSGEVFSDVSSTLNGRFEANGSESLLGLGAAGPLMRAADTRTAHLGTAHGGSIGKWLWSFTGNYDRISTDTFTDTDVIGARDEARSVNALANADLVLSGAVVKLPAGPIAASVRGSVDIRDFDSRSLRGGVAQRATLSRDRGAIQANLDLPIASRHTGGPTWLGNLSLNANLESAQLSDFGRLRTWGYGLNWSPITAVNLIVSATHEEGAPMVEQLGAPLVVTPNVRTFDFTRREAVDIVRVFGGNPNLLSDDRHVVRLGINARPLAKTDLTFSFDYTSTRIDNPIAPFPTATPEIEAALPERFTRDAGGRLLRIDSRPLNFKRSDEEQVRWGINFTRPLGPLPAGMQNAEVRFMGSEADLQKRHPGATIIRAEPGSPMARRFENLTSRVILSLYHTWRLQDDILVRDGVPVLDLLNGSAVGSRGGRPRHELEFQAGAFKRGLGARLTANWQSGTTVRGLPAGSGGAVGDLAFSGYTAVNLSLFANLADRLGAVKDRRWLKGTRVSLSVSNLFDSRPDVRDAAGSTPLIYQPAYLDPLGRSVSINVRKVF